MNRLLISFFTMGFSLALNAQQTALLSHYQWAPLLYNPAESGRQPALTTGAAWRSQWLNTPDAPVSQALFVEKGYAKTGLGATLLHDQAGALGSTDVAAAYSYRIPLSARWTIKAGLSASVSHWRTDWSSLRLEHSDDAVFLQNISRTVPNFGAGIVLSSPHWQIGISVPKWFEYRLNQENEAFAARTLRHFFGSVSGDFPLKNAAWDIQPQLVVGSATWISNAPGPVNQTSTEAPAAADLGLMLGWKHQWRAGLSWRSTFHRTLSSDHALALQAGWNTPKGWSITAVYEVPLNAIRRSADGSFELLLSYPFRRKSPSLPPPAIVPPPPPVTTKPIISRPDPAPVPAMDTLAATEPPVPDGTARLYGIVFDMTTGLPFHQVLLTVSNTCGESIEPFITPPDGRYRISATPGCCYIIRAQKEPYKDTVTEKICVPPSDKGQLVRMDIDLFLK